MKHFLVSVASLLLFHLKWAASEVAVRQNDRSLRKMKKGTKGGKGGGKTMKGKKTKSPKQSRAEYLAKILDLVPHPEGGFFRETFRSTHQIQDNGETRDASTAIYYLFDDTAVSKFHRLDDDEVWHYYEGSCAVIIHMLKDGKYSYVKLGSVDSGYEPQAYVVRDTWFGVERASYDCDYVLMGTTVAPGFEFSHWELAERDALLQEYPDYEDVILRLT